MRVICAAFGVLGLVPAFSTEAYAESAMYVGSGAFLTCAKYSELDRNNPIHSEFQNWTYGYWSARNHVNSHTGKEVKNLAHPSVLGEAFLERMGTQCMGQQTVTMMEIVQQVYLGLPKYE